MSGSVNWQEQFKLRTVDCNKPRDKHEVCKLLLLRKIIRKHKSEKHFIKIYAEFEVTEGIICDLYFEHWKNKNMYAYEIQKDMSKTKEIIKKYEKWDEYKFTTDLIIIDLNKLSDNIEEMEKQLEEYIY